MREGRVDARLRIVGSPDARYPEAGETARRLGMADRVEWAGYLDDAALLRFYDGLGAAAQTRKLFYRLSGDALAELAKA